jgi:hypothetical protein
MQQVAKKSVSQDALGITTEFRQDIREGNYHPDFTDYE